MSLDGEIVATSGGTYEAALDHSLWSSVLTQRKRKASVNSSSPRRRGSINAPFPMEPGSGEYRTRSGRRSHSIRSTSSRLRGN